MFASIRPLAFTLAAGMILPAAASAVTFELDQNNPLIPNSGYSVAGNTVTFTQPDGVGSLNLILTGGTTTAASITSINEGGGGGASGLGVFSEGIANSANSGNEISYFANDGTTILGEGFFLSFTDGSNNSVDVEFVSLDFAILSANGIVETNIGSYSDSLTGDTSFTLPLPSLAGGTQASVFAGVDGTAGTSFRLSGLEVNVVPEPASLSLLCAGSLLLAGRRRA